MMDRTKQVWGLDEEGEISGSYRPSGQKGVSMPRYPTRPLHAQ